MTNAAQLEAITQLVEVPALCDYMLLNLYGAYADWDAASNWYAARKRTQAGRFVFIVWEGEPTLEKVADNRLKLDDDFCLTRLIQKRRACAEFRAAFAARAHRHLSGEGVLTPAQSAARYRRLAESLDPAIAAESAHWGDYRRDVHRYKEDPFELYTRDSHWRTEVKRLLEDYFPKRAAAFIEQLKAVQLY